MIDNISDRNNGFSIPLKEFSPARGAAVCKLPNDGVRQKKHRLLPLLLGILLVAFSQSACNVTKHLDESKDERLMVKNSIELKSDKRLKSLQRSPLLYELATQYKQIPNRRPLVLFRTPSRVWLYYRFKDKKSSSAKWIVKKLAEPPTIFDELLTQNTAKNFQNLVHQRGYFDATCSYEKKNVGKHKAEVKYTIHLGPLHTIERVEYESRDSQVYVFIRRRLPDRDTQRAHPGMEFINAPDRD